MHSKTLTQQIVENERNACDDRVGESILDELLVMIAAGQSIDIAVSELARRTSDPVLVALLYRVANRVRESP